LNVKLPISHILQTVLMGYKKKKTRKKGKRALTCLDKSSLQSVYNETNLQANERASMKPSATNMISQISSVSGATMAQGL
jgi:hypothetical protein